MIDETGMLTGPRPPLRMPMQAAPVDRSHSVAAGAGTGDGVQADGLGGFIEDISSGNWGGIGKDVLGWLFG